MYTAETMKKKRLPEKLQCVTNASKTSHALKNKRGRPVLKRFGDSGTLHSQNELTADRNCLFVKSTSNETSSEDPTTLDYKNLMAQCVDVCQHLERACSGEEVVAENDSNHTVSIAPGAVSPSFVASDLQQSNGNCSTNEINKSASMNANFVDWLQKRAFKRPSLFRPSSTCKKQTFQPNASDKPSLYHSKAGEEADCNISLTAGSREQACDSNAQSQETNPGKFISNGGFIEIPFIVVKSSFESRYRQYKCVFCSKLLDKVSQYEDHWLSHIKAQGSLQMQWKFFISPNSMAEPGSQFDNDDDKDVCEKSFSILKGTKPRAVDLNLTSDEKLHSSSNFSEAPGQHSNRKEIFKNSIETGDFVSQRPPSKIEVPRELETPSRERSPSCKDDLVAVNETVHGVEKEPAVMSDQHGTEISPNLSRDTRNSKHIMNLKNVNSLVMGYEDGFYEPHDIGSISKPNKPHDCGSDGTESIGKVPCSTRTEALSVFDTNKTFLAAQSSFATSMPYKPEECVQNKAKSSNEIPCSSETEVLTIGSNVQKEELHKKEAESQEEEVAPREASSPNPTARSSGNTLEDICHGSREDAVIIRMIDPADLKSKVDEVLSEIVIHEEEDNLEPSMPDDEEIVSNENDVQSHAEGEMIILQYEEERCRSDDTESRTVDQLINFANDLNERMREKQEAGNETLADSQLEGKITSGDAESEPSARSSGRDSPKRICANNSNPLTCKFCNKKFKTKETLRHHNRNQHRDVRIGGFPCEICSKVYDKRLSWKEHMRRCRNSETHNPKKIWANSSNPLTCKFCNKKFKTKETLRHHNTNQHRDVKIGGYPCEICSKVYDKRLSWKEHMRRCHNSDTHNPKKIWANSSNPLTCKFCNKKFKTKETLRHHNTNQHRDVKIGGFPCEICSKVYDKRLSWKEHMRRCHNPNPEVSLCEMCGTIFSRPEYLRQHMQCVHSYMIKYSCSLCHQAFKTKFIYDRHMNRFHKDLDRFKHKCSHCPWASNTLSRYKQHVNRHVKKDHV